MNVLAFVDILRHEFVEPVRAGREDVEVCSQLSHTPTQTPTQTPTHTPTHTPSIGRPCTVLCMCVSILDHVLDELMQFKH